MTAKGDAVIVADTWHDSLRRIDLSTAATGTLAGMCGPARGAASEIIRIRDGLGIEARMYTPQRLIPVPHMSDERVPTERELLIVLPVTIRSQTAAGARGYLRDPNHHCYGTLSPPAQHVTSVS